MEQIKRSAWIALACALLMSAQATTPSTQTKTVNAAATPTTTAKAKELPEAARTAADLSANWSNGNANGKVSVSLDSKGRVEYPYGDAMPVIICSPLCVCAIELEPGEKLTGDVHIGDTPRWDLSLEYYGNPNDGSQVPVFIVKPHFANLDTNLVVTTDRRIYYMRLVSSENAQTAQVTFRYPEQQSDRIHQAIAAHTPVIAPISLTQQPTQEEKDQAVRDRIASMRFPFSFAGGKNTPCLKPQTAYEDEKAGTTFIQMPKCISVRSLPVLLVREGGKEIQTTYRYVDGVFVIDRLFDSAVLRLGGDKRSIKNEVHIERTKELAANER